MSLLNQLHPSSGSRHKSKRLGRGKSSGHGGTSTKGHKGQKARSGFGLLRGFEGGQMPLVRSLPKFGFTNKRFKTKYSVINVSDLNRFDTEVTPESLYKVGFIQKNALVKILANGSLDKALTVKAHHFSKKAIELIEKAGGKAEKLSIYLSRSDNSKETEGKEAEGKETEGKETQEKVAETKEALPSKEAKDKATKTKETEGKEAEGKEAEGKEAEGKEAKKEDTANKKLSSKATEDDNNGHKNK